MLPWCSKLGRLSLLENALMLTYALSPVACIIKVYDLKFKIVNYASVCSIAYNRNL